MSAQYFAQIDDNNVCTDIAVVTSEFMAENPERYSGTWVETFWCVEGKTYAGVGFTYDPVNDVFIAPQPFGSWTLDDNFDWQPPTPMPSDASETKRYVWFEPNRVWIELV